MVAGTLQKCCLSCQTAGQWADVVVLFQTLDTITISADAKHRLRGEMAKLVQQLLDEQKKAASASKEQASQAALDAVQEVLCFPPTDPFMHVSSTHWCKH